MKFKYDGKSRKSGVYRITNLVNEKIYIGSCAEFKRRSTQHRSALLNGKHHNKHLQASWNKHGADAFLFEVVEVVSGDKADRTTREQFYIDQWKDRWEKCYNFKKNTVEKERSCFSKDPEETKRKLSKAQKRLWKDLKERKKRIEGKDGKRRERIGKAAKRVWAEMSEEDKQAHLEKSLWTNQGWKKGSKHTKETRKKMSEICKERFKDSKKRQRLIDQGQRMAKTYHMINPEGKKVKIHNMSKFCREHNLRKQSMLEVGNGKKVQYKGWTCNEARVFSSKHQGIDCPI